MYCNRSLPHLSHRVSFLTCILLHLRKARVTPITAYVPRASMTIMIFLTASRLDNQISFSFQEFFRHVLSSFH
ncbi:hypothetical protein DEU56DRAFT_791479 [Suillus clintonianus]|uniref:uncharacterized protein n=1 Tax=Suillus clintonianus TaxID=1904413 RepID=UPI001B869089|nr:uncharacterized protein DEU56DRAFT_791479 [Suillus clintonianus]KAG2143600.1 hypothetical protein DEU56DRAFT_791479 [Suillus clintonianus]